MSIEIKVPVLPESVADATVVTWHKKPGDTVRRDENLVDLETDKVVLEVPAPADGILESITKNTGATVLANEVLGVLKVGAAAAATPNAVLPAKTGPSEEKAVSPELSPSVRRLVAEHDVDVSKVNGSGKAGRITKTDVQQFVQQAPASTSVSSPPKRGELSERGEQRVPMTRLRARIAERLLDAQQHAAILTTFNEVNLQAVMDLRARYKDQFEKSHGVKLGFMSFFTRAAVEALKRFPAVNASIEGTDIIYHDYYDVGIAVSTERGLVVPIIRDANKLSFAAVEAKIGEYGARARDGQLSIEEMTGGTFTITNGGVFGSLLSTPIINPPQSAILGMHKIEERPVVEKGQIVIRPMMYLALSYDHRLIDGKDSVKFLVTIKELLEDPARLLLDI
ncbi:MAG: 2-oxoglutarate dehydrogenase complex dihydrolipoyllysine-residue succinyltransferase [Gammaproteobacteria bacterium]